jgi:hypothetical protein
MSCGWRAEHAEGVAHRSRMMEQPNVKKAIAEELGG